MFRIFKKKNTSKKMFDLGKTLAKITHMDGSIYYCTLTGTIKFFFDPNDNHYTSEQRMKLYLKHATPLEMDCGTYLYKEAINNVKLTTTSYLVEGIDYGNS